MLAEKVVVVTGATRGIGRAIALMAARERADVAFIYRSNEEMARELEAQIHELDRKVYSQKVDIADFDQVQKFMVNVVARFEKIDCLINNSGITRDKALVMMEKEDWNSVISTNLTGTFNACRTVVYGMIKRRAGQIINITSVGGVLGLNRQTNYAASKAGVIGFTRALAKELADFNIRVNAIAPGYIDTEMVGEMPDSQKKKALAEIPMKRFGTCEEVANLVKYLLSGGDSYLTGALYPIDGGRLFI